MGSGGVAHHSWHRIVFDLRNTRNIFARQHPQFVFHAIAKFAARSTGIDTRWLLYPLEHSLPDRIRRDEVHRLAWVLPAATHAEATCLAEALINWLRNPDHNFELLGDPAVQPRSLQILCDEVSPDLLQIPEILIDVLTPLTCPPAHRNGLLNASDLGELCRSRLNLIAPWFTPADPDLWRGLHLLSWFWQLSPRFEHESRSQATRGVVQWLQGYQGPLFLRGAFAPVLPTLLLASEFTVGHRLKVGEGRFILRSPRPIIDPLLADPSRLLACWETLRSSTDLDLDLIGDAMQPVETLAATAAAEMGTPGFTFAPASRFTIQEPGRRQRTLHQLQPRDVWIQKSIHLALLPLVDRILRPEVIGYRPGHSTHNARPLIEAAVRQGCTHALETDISGFFDHVPWAQIDQVIHDFLPLTEVATRQLLSAAIRQQACLRDQSPAPRTEGLLQGSPLSPLLANLFLSAVDQELARSNHLFIRFADDILVLTRGSNEAVAAQTFLESVLARYGLQLNAGKCRITPLDLGIEYLGHSFDADLTVERILATRVRHPLWIRRPYASLGIDGDVLLVRQDRVLSDRIPLHRVSELILVNAGAVGIHLLHRCSELGIPIAFCDATGRFQQLVDSANRARLDTAGHHHARHRSLPDPARLAIARSLITAKIQNYLRWFHHVGTDPCRRAVAFLERSLTQLDSAEDIPSLRGHEGFAARETFAALRPLLRQEGFANTTRQPGRKPDPFNALLDFGYTQLFLRIETLLHSRGLNPWLGILHDDANPYPSLVCDLQEPFRARVDRWAVKVVNRREINLAHFEPSNSGPNPVWKINRQGWPLLIESFAREELIGLAHETHAWIDQLAAQVRVVQDWARTDSPWSSYTSPSRPLLPTADPEEDSAPEPDDDDESETT